MGYTMLVFVIVCMTKLSANWVLDEYYSTSDSNLTDYDTQNEYTTIDDKNEKYDVQDNNKTFHDLGLIMFVFIKISLIMQNVIKSVQYKNLSVNTQNTNITN